MDKSIEKILLEIVNRKIPSKKNSNLFNLNDFDQEKAALAFLLAFNRSNLIKSQKITIEYNNDQPPLHLIVRNIQYNNINSNTKVQFIYRRILFSQIKLKLISIRSKN